MPPDLEGKVAQLRCSPGRARYQEAIVQLFSVLDVDGSESLGIDESLETALTASIKAREFACDFYGIRYVHAAKV